MNHKKLFQPLLLATAAALALPALAQHNITVVNFGGANGAAQKKAFVEAYEKTTGGKITTVEYNGDKLKTAPTGWADFWDVKKFPGKRGLRKGARYNLEFALMADGVKAADVYKVLGTKDGADRAFKKLGELKPHIQWWEAGALPPQFLVAGDVAMTTAFSGRIDAAQREGQNLKITWTGGIYDLDFWVMPKGGANKEAAMKFIALASSPDAQAEYARHISYGPTHTKAMAKIDPKVQALLPTSPANSKDALRFDVAFWADQGEALEKRFAAWAAQ